VVELTVEQHDAEPERPAPDDRPFEFTPRKTNVVELKRPVRVVAGRKC
jgi:hypothetical protein